jgi:hypothetical protein
MVSNFMLVVRQDMYSLENREPSHGGEMIQTAHDLGVSYTGDEMRPEQPPVRTKFNISMEKKIERLWQESDRQGWSYSQFVTVVMEVLTVLHHRKRLVQAKPAHKKQLSERKRSLS